MNPTRSTAIHEAGHAVAAWHYGCRLDVVTVDKFRRDGVLGFVRWNTSSKASTDQALAGCVIALAGVEAEALAGEVAELRGADLEHLEHFAAQLEPSAAARGPLREWLRARTRALLSQAELREGLFTLADHLERRITLIDDEAAALIERTVGQSYRRQCLRQPESEEEREERMARERSFRRRRDGWRSGGSL